MPIVDMRIVRQIEIVVHENYQTKGTKMKLKKSALIAAATAIASLGLLVQSGSPVSAMKTEGCRTFSTGRTTCSYSNGLGGTSWNSYNPYSGYQSYGYRQRSGNSSWGTYNFSYGSGRSGSRSYNSYCFGC